MNITLLNLGEGSFPDDRYRSRPTVRDKCDIAPYQISYFQVGSGASGVPETSGVFSLGSPLSDAQYGSIGRSVEPGAAMLYLTEGVPLTKQDFITIANQGVLGASSFVSVILLDEQTANGQTLNEVGLFVDNPFLATSETGEQDGVKQVAPIRAGNLLGQENSGGGESRITTEAPGRLLAAYRHIPSIQKEDFFSLLIRWSINFSVPRT